MATQDEPPPAAVIFAAKSSEDDRGSNPRQLRDCRAAAEAEGREVVAEYKDENASAYSGNRGTDLKRAMAHAERLRAEGREVELWVVHSDRLARGDGKRAKHLVHYAVWALDHDVTIRSVQDPQTFSSLGNAGGMGDRNNDDSKRKSAATRIGLDERRESGKAVGAIPLGYRWEHLIENGQLVLDKRGRPVTARVIETHGAEVYEQIVAECELGRKPGETSRTLNAIGERTRRGKKWTTRAVRYVLANPDYIGSTGYPPLIDEARWNALQERLRRPDATAVQARKGGRPGVNDFVLRGLAFCRDCGEPMRCRRYRNGTRRYRCSGAMEGRGSCDSQPVPADLAETHVLSHFESIVGDRLGSWLAERAEEHAAELKTQMKSVEGEREYLSKLERQRDRAAQQHRRLLDAEDDDRADAALDQLVAVKSDIKSQLTRVADAESRAAEWRETPTYDAALAYLAEMVELVRGRVSQAACVSDVNAALRDALTGVWVSYDGQTFRADVRLRIGNDVALMVDYANPNWRPADTLVTQAGIDATMLRLQEMLADPDHPIHRPLDDVIQTEPQTFVYVQPLRWPISSYERPCAFIISALASSGFSARSASAERRTRSLDAI